MLVNFWCLPAALKLVGLAGALLAVAAVALALPQFLSSFNAVGLSALDDPTVLRPYLSSLIALSLACTSPVSWYAARSGRRGEADAALGAQRMLLAVALPSLPEMAVCTVGG
jgi:hypothetical protein